jgi:hypothetical protein
MLPGLFKIKFVSRFPAESKKFQDSQNLPERFIWSRRCNLQWFQFAGMVYLIADPRTQQE